METDDRGGASTDLSCIAAIDRERLERVLARLPHRHVQVLVAAGRGRLPNAEIAQLTGLTGRQAEILLADALYRLDRELDEDGDAEDAEGEGIRFVCRAIRRFGRGWLLDLSLAWRLWRARG